MVQDEHEVRRQSLRGKIHEVIFEADTPAGKRFDIILLIMILASVAVVMLESVAEVRNSYPQLLAVSEWTFTVFFTIEYVLRLFSVSKPLRYATSFFGIIDLLSILPSYMALMSIGQGSLRIIRILRLLRVFRVLKLFSFLHQAQVLTLALKKSSSKIIVFLVVVLCMTVLMGTIMYIVEDSNDAFTSIPRSIYWAIVTLTTVGYGDITPETPLGQTIAGVIMIIGYAIIAVPTGIVSLELKRADDQVNTRSCPACGREGHEPSSDFCKHCGSHL